MESEGIVDNFHGDNIYRHHRAPQTNEWKIGFSNFESRL